MAVPFCAPKLFSVLFSPGINELNNCEITVKGWKTVMKSDTITALID